MAGNIELLNKPDSNTLYYFYDSTGKFRLTLRDLKGGSNAMVSEDDHGYKWKAMEIDSSGHFTFENDSLKTFVLTTSGDDVVANGEVKPRTDSQKWLFESLANGNDYFVSQLVAGVPKYLKSPLIANTNVTFTSSTSDIKGITWTLVQA